MESAMVETTNETDVDTIQMEQWTAEFNVAMAAFNAFNKYALISEYAQCDVDEFVQESLEDKIDKVDEWKNSGGKAKKALGTAASALLKMIKGVTDFFKRLFGKETNPFARLAKWLRKVKALKSGHGMAIDTKKVGTDVNRRIADNEEKAKLRGELKDAKTMIGDLQSHSAAQSKEIKDLKGGVKQLGLQVADWRARYEAVEKSLNDATTALESLKKAKSENDASLKKSELLLERACDLLANVAAPHNRIQAKKYNKLAAGFLDSENVDYYGNHAAAKKKAAETMDDLIVDADELAKKSAEIPAKVEKLGTLMADIKDSDAGAFMPPAVVTSLQTIIKTTNEVGHASVKSVADLQKDPVIAAFNISK